MSIQNNKKYIVGYSSSQDGVTYYLIQTDSRLSSSWLSTQVTKLGNNYNVDSNQLNLNYPAFELWSKIQALYNFFAYRVQEKEFFDTVSLNLELYNGNCVLFGYSNNDTSEYHIRDYYFYTGSLYVDKKLEDTNKLAYLNTFPVQFADDDDYKQCLLDFLNIIATEVANLFYKSQITPVGTISINNDELVDVLSTIGEILHDKELTQPILINQNNTENFASLENEDWNFNNEY